MNFHDVASQATARKSIIAQGPCAICGGPFAAHRTVETQLLRLKAGELLEEIACDYGTFPEQMVAQWLALVDLLCDTVATK